MGVVPSDFEDHCERVTDQFDDELAYRNAISRGYYCAFHTVKENNRNHPKAYFKDGPGDHGQAKAFLNRINEKNLADTLDDLHTKRKTADYELDEDIDDMEYAMFKRNLEDFLLDLKRSNSI